VEPQPEDPGSDFDVITWELFRQILSPYVDPLNHQRAEALADILANRTEELERYRKKCEQLADQMQTPETLAELTARVQRFVRLHIADEIAELLRLNRRARDDYIAAVLEDEKTWATTLGRLRLLRLATQGCQSGPGSALSHRLGRRLCGRRVSDARRFALATFGLSIG
jgi:hypothetical protein